MNTIHKSIRISLVSFVLGFGLLSAYEAAAEELLAPQSAIKTASTQMKSKLQDKNFTKDFEQVSQFVEEIIYPHVDFNRISALVLGKHWKKADKSQREEFKKEFQKLLIRTYSRAFLAFDEWSVRFLPLKLEPNAKKALVKTEVLQPGKQPIAVNYRMVLVKGDWKVYDIIIEGISLVTNYRTSFKNEVKRTGSLDAVITNMSERNIEAFEPKGKNS